MASMKRKNQIGGVILAIGQKLPQPSSAKIYVKALATRQIFNDPPIHQGQLQQQIPSGNQLEFPHRERNKTPSMINSKDITSLIIT